MKVTKTAIEGLLIIEPDIYSDDRGYFFESFNQKKYAQIGITERFLQDNQSCSKKDTIRGLHYQVGEYAQSKLVRVITGKAIDYAVDIRFGSPTFRKYVAVELSAENQKQLWIPVGFAHGFISLKDNTILQYKCTAYYSQKNEKGIIFNDPDIGINWNTENPIITEKDFKYPFLKNIEKDFHI
ncbi:dTDP-4-dehydrorhamnose 3,5-epimerase [bacterium]|nr:MAG: dTDP-4-dehydrorhamnose 3,5-epimerase [bacterium]